MDGVGTIKTINYRSVMHTERNKAKPPSYDNFHTEHMNMDTQFLNAYRLPKGSALGLLSYSELAWRGKRQNIPLLLSQPR